MKNVSKNNQCCYGCGICAGVCPTGSIEMTISKEGAFIPTENEDKCINCGLCNKVCPWQSFDYKEVNKFVYNTEDVKDVQIGNFKECYSGYATDDKLRHNSSSGGLITSILIFALEEKIIDGAVVTRMKKDNPLIPESFIATTREEIISAAGSKYISVSLDETIKEIMKSDGRYAVVGLPCHIQALRKAELSNKSLNNKIVFHLGLICSGNISSFGTELLADALSLDHGDIMDVCYRGKGWPGGFKAKLRNGKDSLAIAYKDYFSIIRFHTLLPCLVCWDTLNEFSDISFGDAWIKSIEKEGNIGTSLIISRTVKGERLLRGVEKKGLVMLDKIDSETVVRSKAKVVVNFKKRNAKLKISLLKLSNKDCPNFINIAELEKSNLSTKLRTVFLFGRCHIMSIGPARRVINIFLKKYLILKIKKSK